MKFVVKRCFLLFRERIKMKIDKFESIKEKINKLDSMAKSDPAKIHTIFKAKQSHTVSDRMKIFFSVADGDMSFKI